MSKEEAINTIIASGCDTNKISDGYHTFGELYDHRCVLFIALCRLQHRLNDIDSFVSVWRSRCHSDGSRYKGWFLLGMNSEPGKQITYHLPDSFWHECDFAETLIKAPDFDGHTSKDVTERLIEL